jgi:hypothetical protein
MTDSSWKEVKKGTRLAGSTEYNETAVPHVELYKVTLCKYFVNGGGCNKGEACTFAHGEGDLRKFSKPKSYPPIQVINRTQLLDLPGLTDLQELTDVTTIKEAIANARKYIKEYMDSNNLKGDIKIDIKITE